MATYQFRSKGGAIIEREYPMVEAPPIGKVVRIGGVAYRRVASTGVGMEVKDRPHLARSAPRKWTPGLAERYDKWGPHGTAAIDCAEDKRRFQKALKECKPRNSWEYDP